MAKVVQLLFDWTGGAALPPVTLMPVERAAPHSNLPGVPVPQSPTRPARRHPARLPVPKPLPSAIAERHFGEDERGPVRPAAAEVRAITEQHAERLIELLGCLRNTESQLRGGHTNDRTTLIQEKDRVLSAYQSGIALYAEDFGEHAAERLDAYVRHQFEKDRS